MSDRKLKAVEALQRPPLTNLRERLRLLADELPEDVTSLVIISYPDRGIYQFGEMETIAQTCGMLFLAASDLAGAKQP